MPATDIVQPECRTGYHDKGDQPFYDFYWGTDFILASLFPPLGAFFNSLPQAVLGGCTVMMFGSIMYEGIKMLKNCEFNDRTMIIVSLLLSLLLPKKKQAN